MLISLLGIVTLLGVGWVCSRSRKDIRWRTVLGAFFLQISLGAFVLWVPWGQQLLDRLTNFVQAIISAGNEGISFLFGSLLNLDIDGEPGSDFIFALQVLPVIIFFSALISVLYYLGVMRFVINIIGGCLQKILGTSRTESLSATANIFVGQTEAPLVVKPYIPNMTRSELFAVMVGGLASVAGSILAGYAGLGVELKYLLAACFMAAPGGLLFAKLLIPETETPTQKIAEGTDNEKPVNVLDAAAQGASEGLKLALNVGAMLLAFIGLIALINLALAHMGGWVGQPDLSLEFILGWLFAPVAWLLGIPWNEAQMGGSFIGKKIIVNEFVAYLDFTDVKATLSNRTQAIITFALCGFANLSSIAILLGGLGGMAPTRRKEIAQLGLLAVFAATMSNLMSACIAGVFL